MTNTNNIILHGDPLVGSRLRISGTDSDGAAFEIGVSPNYNISLAEMLRNVADLLEAQCEPFDEELDGHPIVEFHIPTDRFEVKRDKASDG